MTERPRIDEPTLWKIFLIAREECDIFAKRIEEISFGHTGLPESLIPPIALDLSKDTDTHLLKCRSHQSIGSGGIDDRIATERVGDIARDRRSFGGNIGKRYEGCIHSTEAVFGRIRTEGTHIE